MSIKYIEHMEQMSKLSQKIVRAHPNGYCGAVVDGPRGYGKSAFCMHTMREVYQYVDGIDRDDAWRKVLDNMLFTIGDVIKALGVIYNIDMNNVIESQESVVIPCVCWDDAGMHGGRLKHFIDMNMVDQLNSVMDTARDAVTGFLINAPEREGMLSFIRRYRDNLWINVGLTQGMGDKYKRVATVRRMMVRHDGRRVWRLAFQTTFSCYVDKWAYSEYKVKKIQAVKSCLEHLKDLHDKKETDKKFDYVKYKDMQDNEIEA
jgi:hypothetical protein